MQTWDKKRNAPISKNIDVGLSLFLLAFKYLLQRVKIIVLPTLKLPLHERPENLKGKRLKGHIYLTRNGSGLIIDLLKLI